ncbi:MAG: CBS domain-containing protein [Alphaproteobacteria bacterium]|nr:CBS domain-containing protein [Alphaproteobacteria bacterium]
MLIKQMVCQEKRIVTIDVGDSVYTACHRMTENHVSMLVVLNGNELAGLFSEHDLSTNVLDRNLDPRKTMVCSVMSPVVVAASPRDSLDHALALVERYRLHHLPVIEGGRVVDILSLRQLYRLVNQTLAADLDHLRAYIHGDYSAPVMH